MGHGLGGILSPTWRERSSYPYGYWGKSIPGSGKSLSKGPRVEVLGRFWGTARRSECLGHCEQGAKKQIYRHMLYTLFQNHLKEEEIGTKRVCDLYNVWQTPELRRSSSDPKPCVFIKIPFRVYFRIALTFSLPLRCVWLKLSDIRNHTFSGCLECSTKFK